MADRHHVRTHNFLRALLVASCSVVVASDLVAQEVERWRVSTQPEIEIGETTGEDVYLFQSIQSAHFLPGGRIVVADAGQHVLRVYGPDGEFEKVLGGPGYGPGEFRDIKGTWLTSDGRIAVWDAGNRRITTFGLDGALTSAERVTVSGQTRLGSGNLEVFLGAFSDDDALLASLVVGSGRGAREVLPDPWVLGRFGLDGERRGGIGELRGMRRIGGHPVPFSPMPHVVVHVDSLYVADGYEAEISVRDESGVEVRKIGLARRELSSEGVWSSLEAELRQRRSRSPVYQLSLRNLERGRVPQDDYFPQIADLLIDDLGYLWVKVFELPDDSIWLREKGALWPAPGGVWRVVRPDGGSVATVRMPEDVRPLEIRGDRMLGLAQDGLGVERIVVHRIERR